MHKPRILLITRNLPPLVGGMERLVLQAALGISDYAALTVIGPKGCSDFLPSPIKTHEVSHNLASFIARSALIARSLARKNAFDIVLGGSGLAALSVLFASRRARAKSALFVHGLDLVVDNWVYQRIFVPQILRVDSLIANSRNTHDIAVAKSANPKCISIVNPGTALPSAHAQGDRESFCDDHGIPFKRYIVFVGRMTERKGLSAFLRESFVHIIKAAPGTGLVVIGHEPSHSLNKRGEEAKVLETVDAMQLTNHVKFLGKLTDGGLMQAYAHADVQIFPLQEVSGDVEGFGMVAIEAASCGTPTVAFNVGGVSDAVTHRNGLLVPTKDYAQFATGVIKFLGKDKPSASQCREFAAQFAWPNYNKKIKEILSALAPSRDLDSQL